MKISLDALLTLDAIERQGSFAAAAKALHRVPSAVTYTIQKLEQDLDVSLFERQGRRAVLTEVGRELLREGRRLLEAAGQLECHVQQVAKGWEAELVIAIEPILPMQPLLDLLAAFYAEQGETRIRLSHEVLSGSWDALLDGRADLVLGANGDLPSGGGLRTEPLCELDFVYAVAPQHPLALLPEPLLPEQRVRHRAVVIADSSRRLPVRSVGLLSGQDTLTVPDLRAKLAAQIAGLGAGHLPLWVARPEIEAGRLVARQTEEGHRPASLLMAWRADHRGKALEWFLSRLATPEWKARFAGE
jgi:DNA-binding transcriptional LysR family regulator